MCMRRGGAFLLMLLAGCGSPLERPVPSKPPAPRIPHPDRAPPAPAAPVRILALGDSYTIGESVAESERWPVLLAAQLREAGIPSETPEIIARTGWTTDELNAGIDRARPQGPYEIVTLLIGVNNQFRGRPEAEFRIQFRSLLARAIEFARGREASRVLVLSIPDWGAMPFGARYDPAKVAREIDRFNAIKKEETDRAGARWIEITALSREVRSRPELGANDGLHPSSAQYAAWVERALPAARDALAGAPTGASK